MGEEKRSGRLVGAAETSKEHTEWHRLQERNLNILGLLKRKEWPQFHRESSWHVHWSHLFQKEKEQSRQSRVPDHKGERVKVSESCTLTRESMKWKEWTLQRRKADSKEDREGKQSLPRRSKRKHERVNGRKSSPGRSAES